MFGWLIWFLWKPLGWGTETALSLPGRPGRKFFFRADPGLCSLQAKYIKAPPPHNRPVLSNPKMRPARNPTSLARALAFATLVEKNLCRYNLGNWEDLSILQAAFLVALLSSPGAEAEARGRRSRGRQPRPMPNETKTQDQEKGANREKKCERE